VPFALIHTHGAKNWRLRLMLLVGRPLIVVFMGGLLVGCMVMVIGGIRAARKAERQQ
tara:strand:- start:4686 stop:4856 length:171 start_codon:yes stop_codon:yes gene_type:complete